jgi:divalent metal cation (Fe/Co/Zn/Cd) transporter
MSHVHADAAGVEAQAPHAPQRSHAPQMPLTPGERAIWVRRAQLLAGLGVGWHAVEAAVAVLAGLLAGSIALVGFGADSVVEALAGFIVLWRFAATRASSEEAERRAQQLIALSFFLIAAYVGVEAIRTLLSGEIPRASWLGIGLALVTTVTMPLLARAKARVGDCLNSAATKSEGQQNMLCAYLSVALLVGLGANAVLGWWWADPLTALLIAGVAVKEGWETWRGDPCCDDDAVLLASSEQTPRAGKGDGCQDECCR